MFNPVLLGALLKSKLDEIISGVYPEGFTLKERTENKIFLKLSMAEQIEGVELKSLTASVNYNGYEIFVEY